MAGSLACWLAGRLCGWYFKNIRQQTAPWGENTPRHNFQTLKKPCERFIYVCKFAATFFYVWNQRFFLRFHPKMAPAKKNLKKLCERLQIVLRERHISNEFVAIELRSIKIEMKTFLSLSRILNVACSLTFG